MQLGIKNTNVVSLPESTSFTAYFTLRRVFVLGVPLSLFSLAVRQCSSIDWDFLVASESGQYITKPKAFLTSIRFHLLVPFRNGLRMNGCLK
jgi:hypothetical protein